MSLKDKTPQELEDIIEAGFDRLSRALREAEARTCTDAAKSTDPAIAEANADLSIALGHVQIAKGYATKAGLKLPDVSVRFGSK